MAKASNGMIHLAASKHTLYAKHNKFMLRNVFVNMTENFFSTHHKHINRIYSNRFFYKWIFHNWYLNCLVNTCLKQKKKMFNWENPEIDSKPNSVLLKTNEFLIISFFFGNQSNPFSGFFNYTFCKYLPKHLHIE